MRQFYTKILIYSVLAVFSSLVLKERQVLAQSIVSPDYPNRITFEIDSVRIDGSGLVYSIMFWRTNEDWTAGVNTQQDTALGDVDLYFNYPPGVFYDGVFQFPLESPVIERRHPSLVIAPGLSPFLNINCRYHANRFLISLDINSVVAADPSHVNVLYLEKNATELCKIRMSMVTGSVHPGFRWDKLASGGSSNYSDPLMANFIGDIDKNPETTLVLKDYFKKEGYFCQGGEVKLWAGGFSSGSEQKMTWMMSKHSDMSESAVLFESSSIGSPVAEGVHTIGSVDHPVYGEIYYEMSASNQPLNVRVDTLIIPNAHAWMDSMYFRCILSDQSLSTTSKHSNDGDIQVYIRDSIFAYFAASDPDERDAPFGASDRTDTIYKCPGMEAVVKVFFYGPVDAKAEEVFGISGQSGSGLILECEGVNEIGNSLGPISVRLVNDNWAPVAGALGQNGKQLYEGIVSIPLDFKSADLYITAVSTNNCDNGVAYVLYDTVCVTDVSSGVTISLNDKTLSAGATMNILTIIDIVPPPTGIITTIKAPQNGSLIPIEGPFSQYKAPDVIGTCPTCKSDTIIYTYNTSGCDMELIQVVNFAEKHYLKLKVCLQGPYDASTGLMRTLQNLEYSSGGVHPVNLGFPTVSPYMSPGSMIPVSPFPPNFTNGRDTIVDWIQVYLQEGTSPSEVYVDSISCFLLSDGTVCDINGDIALAFKGLPNNSYYIYVMHRNHVSIRSEFIYSLETSPSLAVVEDLRDATRVYDGNVKIVDAAKNIYALFAGTLNKTGGAAVLPRVVTPNDANAIRMSSGNPGYLDANILFELFVGPRDQVMVRSNTGEWEKK